MKNKALLLLGFMALSLSACAPKSSGNNGGGQGGGGGEPSEDRYSQILKTCASQMMELIAPQPAASRGYAPQAAPGQSLSLPAVYLYWAGCLNDIEGVDIIGDAIKFQGVFNFKGMNMVQDMTYDISVDFDEENNNFSFVGKQILKYGGFQNESYLVLTCDYDFTANRFDGFYAFMVPAGSGMNMWMRYVDGVFSMYQFSDPATQAEDPDYIAYHSVPDNGITTITSRIASETVLEGAKLQAAREAFVAACDYCDEVSSSNYDVEIVTEDK